MNNLACIKFTVCCYNYFHLTLMLFTRLSKESCFLFLSLYIHVYVCVYISVLSQFNHVDGNYDAK